MVLHRPVETTADCGISNDHPFITILPVRGGQSGRGVSIGEANSIIESSLYDSGRISIGKRRYG